MRVTQLLPSVHSGDAVGDSAYEMHRALQSCGIESCMLGINIDEHLKDRAISFEQFSNYDSPDTVHIYHFAVPSPMSYAFKEAKGRKVLLYHNITPPHFFEGFSEDLVTITTTGRHEIKLLADATDLGLADSEFNRLELEGYGYRKTGVLPILLDFSKYEIPADPKVLEEFDDGRINILFVGRITPNKKQEDVIKAFTVYKRYIHDNSRLLLVGKYDPDERYVKILRELIEELGIEDVHFSGHVTQAELNAYYRISRLLLCMSEHEGFCVPAVESCYFQLPILAYDCTALPYTLGNSGVLFRKKSYAEIAEMMQELITDSALRDAVIRGQTTRLAQFRKERILPLLCQYLESVSS
ncbi:hypothetical protein CSB45_13055 [candidate division KSB3 bacterium]|uniref:Glycosyl transferase family 1 domain-containing protein n=1 Tax=candidate division KSB3 bacterium TaxID=2044937 RepID=A0A2G6E1S9_9BACT|nr:MAG: hypothetical protein CSB45_13055 [candidate division KSB3 bacterium]PIE28628.1 MAG: hypothetical protein CSA57_12710 [candidate division KSB3 bacterium]